MFKYKMDYSKLNKDLDFGFKSEMTAKDYLEKYFDCQLKNTNIDDGDKFNKFDFRGVLKNGRKCKIELKTRRCEFGDYPDLQFELGKIEKAIELIEHDDYECFFVWRCIKKNGQFNNWGEDGFYLWEFNDDEWFKGEGGRVDRGKNEWKMLCKIKNQYIKKMF